MALDFSFVTINASDKNFDTHRIIIPPLAEQKETKIDIPQMSGYVQLFKKFTKREIRVRGMLHGTSHADLITKIQNFSAFLFSETDQQLIFNNQADRYFLAQHLRNIELVREPTHTLLELLFTCNDPFAYAVTADTPDDQDIIVNDKTWTVQNLGQYYSYPVVTITFNQAQTHIYIINNTLGSVGFDISKSFVLNDVLVIDSKAMTIRLNGESSPAGFGDGGEGRAEFLILMAAMNEGNNELQIGTDDETINVSVNVTFRKVYL